MTNMLSFNQPENTNLLQQTKFVLTFPRLPNIQYFCQEVNIPGISLTEIQQTNPFIDLYRPGNKLQYDLLEIKFLIDEDLRSWIELHDWIRGMAFPDSFAEYQNLKNISPMITNTATPQYYDGSLQVLSALNNTRINVLFYDLFPVSITGINFASVDDSTTTLTASASFRFTYYNFERTTL
jgi:hypothetical protein